jgi:hypothetical protein
MFLSAVSAKKGGVEPCLLIIRVEALSIERNAAVARTAQSGVNVPGARYESVKLKRQKSPIAFPSTFTRWAACQHQKFLKLGQAASFIATSLNS